MNGEPVKYRYNTQLEWTGEKKGILKCEDKPDIVVACPPEFGGHPEVWSPEDIFLASVEICTMTTFLWFANKERLTFDFYKSEATGIVELVGVSSEEDRVRVEKILKKVERACLISNSIKTDVHIEPEILVG